MLTGIDKNQKIEFVASGDNTEPKTIFVLRPLTAAEIMRFSEDSAQKISEKVFALIEMSIVEVKNYDDTKSIKEIIDSLPVNVVNELSVKISEINHLGEVERKNS